MKLLHINSYYATSGLFYQLYERQVTEGFDIDVYVPVSYQFPEERLATKGDYTTVSRNHQQLSRWVFPLKHHRILNDLKTRYDFRKYQLSHAHSLFSNGWLALQLKQEYQIPYVVAVRNADLRTFFQRMPWMRQTGLNIMRQAERIIFISQNTYDEVYAKYVPQHLKASLQANTKIIPNGVDDFWHNNRYIEKEYTITKPIKIVSTAKIMRTKRLVPMAEMIQSYSDHIRPVELHVIGPAWEKNVVKALENIPCVTYYGEKNKEEMKDLYRQMDIFALLSSPETFGLVYVEAMSQGLPVIYTAGEGFDNFFPNYTVGVSVDPSNKISFTDAMDYILAHYETLSSNALNKMQVFKWDEISTMYSQLYQQIIKEMKE